MCGIYGSVGFAPDPARIDLVAHRGPDGRGWAEFDTPSGPVALGHRRLAIVGLGAAGRQPMRSPCGRFHLTFNGEIYNHVELRAELVAQGERFAGDSDTEVLLRALARWGVEETLPRLRGMFAFLLWDRHRQRLVAVRDRFAIKPLYWAGGAGGGIAFASEIKQLLGLPGIEPRMNLARVHDFLAWGVADHTAETMFAAIHQLRGGEMAVVEAGGAWPRIAIRRWYALRVATSPPPTEAEAASRFRAALEEAVRLHLRADVQLGSCLSGGLDSSSIVGLAAGMLDGTRRIATFSACFEEARIDERRFMRAVVARSGAAPHEVFPRADDLAEEAAAITWHQDEPFGSTSILAQWCVFRAARQAGVKVMLDGQGADELLGGYAHGFAWHLAGLLRAGHVVEALRILRERRRDPGLPLLGQGLRLAAALLPPALAAPLRRRRSLLRECLRTDAFAAQRDAPTPQELAVAQLGLPPVRGLGSWCLAMTHASNLPMLLHWEDRSSMAHGVEARVPFLDHPLAEFCLSLGDAHKFAGAESKRVLRRAMEDVLPPEVRARRDKLGFSTPEAEWMRGPAAGFLRAGVEDALRLWPGLLDAAATRRVAAGMLSGRRAADPALWRVVNLGIWGRCFGVLA